MCLGRFGENRVFPEIQRAELVISEGSFKPHFRWLFVAHLFSSGASMRTVALLTSLIAVGLPMQAQESSPPAQAVETAPGEVEASEGEFKAEDIIIENLTEQSEVEANFEEKVYVGRYGIKAQYRDIRIVANQIVISEVTGDVIADGNVRLVEPGQHWQGEHLEYNFKSREMKAGEFKAGFSPLFVKGLSLDGGAARDTYEVQGAELSSDDISEPFFKVRAKKLRIRVGHSVSATSATLYLGKTPVMWLPSYERNLRQHEAYWSLTPGYRSRFGPMLRSEYHFPLYGSLDGIATVDLFGKRGIGFGPGISWDSERWGKGQASYWRINDADPETDFQGNQIPEERERISFAALVPLQTNFTFRGQANWQTDGLVARDFFEAEYRDNWQPKSTFELQKSWDNWNLSLLTQPQFNEFFQTVERLPDLKFSGLRQQLGGSPFFYEGETSAAYLRFDPGLVAGEGFEGGRADTWHQILYPKNFFGWLNVAPRVGGRLTYYTETDGGVELEDQERFVFNTGVETSAKAARVYRGARNEIFDVTGLRHIIEPSLNYAFVPNPSELPSELPQFDREIPSLRLLPVNFPDYNAIDAIDSQHVLRLGLRNKLQTKREGEVQNLVNWALFGDWRLHPEEGQSTFSDFYSDLDFRPRSWITLNSQTQYRIQTGQFQTLYHTATFVPSERWSWRVGHRYFRGGPEYGPNGDNNTLFQTFYYKFNENWAGRISHHFEARDGTLEEQYYVLYRDFRSWTGALTFRVREDRFRDRLDWAIAFTFQLKVLPRFPLGNDANEPDWLLGG